MFKFDERSSDTKKPYQLLGILFVILKT